MELIHTRNDVKTNATNQVAFGISKNSAKLFSMLSSSLYSAKELAILYEIGANCVDAHALNGNQARPWDLVAPTPLDPHVRFRDYGPGLPEDQVIRLLTTYGESTKSDSNDFIGAFGLGSKSPAAVSSTWNIISRFNGELKEYFIVIDRSGIPSLTKIRTQATDEESGLEVIIPINPSRIGTWIDNMRTAYQYYNVRPNIKNYNITWNKETPLISGNTWNLNRVESYNQSAKFITTQRAYSVDKSVLQQEFKNADFLCVLNFGIDIKFQTGELETSLSREQLQYTKHTLDAIEAKLISVYSDIQSMINNIVGVATDGLQFRELVYTAAETLFKQRHLTEHVIKFIKNNKYGVRSNNDLNDFSVKLPIDFIGRVFNGKYLANLTNKFNCWKTHAITLDRKVNNTDPDTIRFKVSQLNKLKIVISDTKDTTKRVRHSLSAYTLIASGNVFPVELQRFVVNASSLPVPPKTMRLPKDKVADQIWKKVGNKFVTIEESDIDKNTTVVAIEFTKANSFSTSVGFIQQQLFSVFSNRDNITVIAMKPGTKLPKFAKRIEMYAKSEIDRLNTESFVDTYLTENFRTSVTYAYGIEKLIISCKKRTTHDSVWNEQLDKVHSMMDIPVTKNTSVDFDYLKTISSIMSIPLKSSTKSVVSVAELMKTMYNSYPMLKFIERYADVPESVIFDYVSKSGK